MRRFAAKFIFFGAMLTLLCGTIYAAVQQSIRQGANDPQIQLAQDTAAVLKGPNANPADYSAADGSGRVDIRNSLAPFINIYDADGAAIAGDGYLDGALIAPPQGVFEYAAQHGENRLTWQPRPGVRIAMVMVHYPDGFVIAGRNMREIELRERHIELISGAAWLAGMVVLALALALKII